MSVVAITVLSRPAAIRTDGRLGHRESGGSAVWNFITHVDRTFHLRIGPGGQQQCLFRFYEYTTGAIHGGADGAGPMGRDGMVNRRDSRIRGLVGIRANQTYGLSHGGILPREEETLNAIRAIVS